MSVKTALLSSTGASVCRALFENSDTRFDLVITDRPCGAEELADDFNIQKIRIDKTNDEFSNELLDILVANKIEYVFVFFTRLLRGNVLSRYNHRLINFHPSLLPACPGMNGFEDSLASGALFIGSTIHFIDSGVDTGKQIFQMKVNVNNKSRKELRHYIFAQQVSGLNEINSIIQQRRLFVENNCVKINNADYDDNSFSTPSLSNESKTIFKNIVNNNV